MQPGGRRFEPDHLHHPVGRAGHPSLADEFGPGRPGSALFVIVKMFDPQSAGAPRGGLWIVLFFDCGPSAEGLPLRMTGFANQAQEGHLVDALARRGDEGRSTLR